LPWGSNLGWGLGLFKNRSGWSVFQLAASYFSLRDRNILSAWIFSQYAVPAFAQTKKA
jgi:hypothetical protein